MPKAKNPTIVDKEKYIDLDEALNHFPVTRRLLIEILKRANIQGTLFGITKYFDRKKVLALAEEMEARRGNRAIFIQEGTGAY